MNAIQRLGAALERDFPAVTVVLFAPDDEDNGTWVIHVYQGDQVLTIEWHAGLDAMGVTRFGLRTGPPDEVVSVQTATEHVRDALAPQ